MSLQVITGVITRVITGVLQVITGVITRVITGRAALVTATAHQSASQGAGGPDLTGQQPASSLWFKATNASAFSRQYAQLRTPNGQPACWSSRQGSAKSYVRLPECEMSCISAVLQLSTNL